MLKICDLKVNDRIKDEEDSYRVMSNPVLVNGKWQVDTVTGGDYNFVLTEDHALPLSYDTWIEDRRAKKLQTAVRDALAETLGEDAMDCTRDWSAWHVGTMGIDDFVGIVEDEHRLIELSDAAIIAMHKVGMVDRNKIIDQCAAVVKAKLSDLTREMEGYSYFGSNPGVPEDDYDDVIDALLLLKH